MGQQYWICPTKVGGSVPLDQQQELKRFIRSMNSFRSFDHGFYVFDNQMLSLSFTSTGLSVVASWHDDRTAVELLRLVEFARSIGLNLWGSPSREFSLEEIQDYLSVDD